MNFSVRSFKQRSFVPSRQMPVIADCFHSGSRQRTHSGAASLDSSNGRWPPQWIEAYAEPSLPSPINAQGMGYRRAIKPEVLAPGGRTLIQDYPSGNENAEVSLYNGSRPPGQCVASPGAVPGDINASWHTRGTSNATALVSRAASMLHDTIDELREEPGGEIIDAVPRSIWLKVLLAHSVEWGAAGSVLDEILRTDENSRQFKEYVTRLIGYGSIDPQRVQECNAYRVTALGGGVLVSDRSHIHRYPLPPALSGQTGYRRLVITLAWFTPVNPRHQGWRKRNCGSHHPRILSASKGKKPTGKPSCGGHSNTRYWKDQEQPLSWMETALKFK